MKKRFYDFVKDILSSQIGYSAILFVSELIIAVLGVANAFVFKNIVNGAVSKDGHLLQLNALYLIITTFVLAIARILFRFYSGKVHIAYENLIKSRIFFNVLSKKYGEVTKKHSAEYLHRITSDSVTIARILTTAIPNIGGITVKFILALAAVIYLMPIAMVVLIPCGISLVVYTFICRNKLKAMHKDIQEKDGKLRVFLQERISSLLIVKAFNKEVQSLQDANKCMEIHTKARMDRIKFSCTCTVLFNLAMKATYLLAVFYAMYNIYYGKLEIGTYVALSSLIRQVRSPISSANGMVSRYYTLQVACERVLEVEKLNDDVQNAYSDFEVHDYYDNYFKKLGLKNVDFSYDDKPVLHNFSFELKKGEIVGIVGRSGIGKTTVLKLLMCLYDLNSGKRYINSNELTSDFRTMFAYVPHENVLLKGTLAEAICFGLTRDDEKIRSILKKVDLEDFDEDLDMPLGEKGSGLSEGQMQRIAIARALYTDRPILLLDEATGALDSKTEKKVLSNIKKMKDKSVIFVTHRKEALGICNKVITIK